MSVWFATSCNSECGVICTLLIFVIDDSSGVSIHVHLNLFLLPRDS